MKETDEFEGILISLIFREEKIIRQKMLNLLCGGSVGKFWEKGGKIFLWKTIAYLVVTHHTQSA